MHERSGSLESLRGQNRRRLIDALRTRGTTTRADLSRETGLSRSTVSSLVADLVRDGLVVEHEGQPTAAPSAQGGRPPVLVSLNRRAGAAVGVDIGKRHVGVAIADLGHEVLAEVRREIGEDHTAVESLDVAAELLEVALSEADVEPAQILGVGMGLPAPIHRETETIGSSAILPGWIGVRAADALSTRLGLPAKVDNDANLGALAERVWGAGHGLDDFLYLKIATGVGAGLVLDGRLFTGAGGTAGEFGHMVVDENGPVCRCANRGCLETLAGGAAIVDLLRPTLGEDLTLARVLELTLAGDAACHRVIADAGRHIGLATANVVNLLNPRRVIVGGELARCGEVLLAPLLQEARRHTIRSAMDDVEIVPSSLGDRAQVLGALALVLLDTETFATPGAGKNPALGTTHA